MVDGAPRRRRTKALATFSLLVLLVGWSQLHSSWNLREYNSTIDTNHKGDVRDAFSKQVQRWLHGLAWPWRTKSLLPGLPEGRGLGRFPSVQERVKVYMGPWYHPPCHRNDQLIYEFHQHHDDEDATTTLPSVTVTANNNSSDPAASLRFDTQSKVFMAIQAHYQDCKHRFRTVHHNQRVKSECLDIASTIPLHLLWSRNNNNTFPPIFLRIADGVRPQPVPSFHYAAATTTIVPSPHVNQSASPTTATLMTRTSATDATNCSTLQFKRPGVLALRQPIVLNLNSPRFLGPLHQVAQWDTPWQSKRDQAIFRGALTGGRPPPGLNATEACRARLRCRLVLQHDDHRLVNAKLTTVLNGLESEVVDGVSLVAKGLSMRELLQYKALIFLPGNDLPSGLNWGLLSRSVVLMPVPTLTSWAMADLLQPYVHYLPLKDDLSNVAEQMQWILDHDEAAQQVAHRSSLWMQDLVFHPEARTDDEAIVREILKRYAAHFRPAQ